MTSPTPRRPRRQQQRAIDTRQRIIDTASRLFVMDGYEGTSVRDIIDSAKTSKGALYQHFPEGKLGVAKAIMKDTLTMDGLKPQRLMLQEIIDIGMIIAHRICNEVALQAALKLSIHNDAPTLYTTPWPEWVQFNSMQLTQAQERDEIPPYVVPEEQAYQIAGNWAGIVLMAPIFDGDLSRVEERISRMYRNLLRALAKPELLPELDFSVHRGRILYSDFLDELAAAQPEAEASR